MSKTIDVSALPSTSAKRRTRFVICSMRCGRAAKRNGFCMPCYRLIKEKLQRKKPLADEVTHSEEEDELVLDSIFQKKEEVAKQRLQKYLNEAASRRTTQSFQFSKEAAPKRKISEVKDDDEEHPIKILRVEDNKESATIKIGLANEDIPPAEVDLPEEMDEGEKIPEKRKREEETGDKIPPKKFVKEDHWEKSSRKRNIEEEKEEEQPHKKQREDPWEYFSCHGYISGSVYTSNDAEDSDNEIPQQNEAEYDQEIIVEKCDPKITVADGDNESIAEEKNLVSLVAEYDPESAVTENENILNEVETQKTATKRPVEEEENEELPVHKKTKKDPWAYFGSYGYISGSIYSSHEFNESDNEDEEVPDENMVADSSKINKEAEKKKTLKKNKRLRDEHGRFVKDPSKTCTAKPLSNKWKEVEKLTESPLLGMKLPFSVLYSNDAVWTRTRSRIRY